VELNWAYLSGGVECFIAALRKVTDGSARAAAFAATQPRPEMLGQVAFGQAAEEQSCSSVDADSGRSTSEGSPLGDALLGAWLDVSIDSIRIVDTTPLFNHFLASGASQAHRKFSDWCVEGRSPSLEAGQRPRGTTGGRRSVSARSTELPCRSSTSFCQQ